MGGVSFMSLASRPWTERAPSTSPMIQLAACLGAAPRATTSSKKPARAFWEVIISVS